MTDNQKRIQNITLTNIEQEIRKEGHPNDYMIGCDVRPAEKHQKSVRVFASKAEERRYNYNSDRRNW